MLTIPEIEASLLLASSTGNKPLLNGTLAAILPEQFSLIAVYGDVLSNLNVLADPALAKSMTRSLMSTAGTHIAVGEIGEAMLAFSQNGNYGALDALTDYLSAEQITGFGATPYAGQTLLNIAANDTALPNDDTVIKSAVRNLMQKLAEETDAVSIGEAITVFSQNKNFGALDAVTDYLTNQQKIDLGSTPAPGQTLLNIINSNELFSTEDDAALAGAVKDFMKKLGAFCDVESIGLAVQTIPEGMFEPFPANFAAMNAIIENLTPEQITALGATYYPSQTLYNLVSTDFGFDNDDAPLAETIGKLIKTLGDQIDIFAIGDAMIFLSPNYIQNWQGLKAIVDNLSDAKIMELNSVFPIQDQVLFNIISSDNSLDESDNIQISNVIHNFMSTLGEGAQGYSVSEAISMFSQTGNYKALDAATDYLTDQQLINMTPFGALNFGPAVVYIVMKISQGGGDPWEGANAVRDLMSKIGAALGNDEFYEDQVIQSVGEFATWTGDAAAFGIDSILGELPTDLLTNRIITEIQSPELPQDYLQQAGVTLGTVGNNSFTGTDLVNDKFIALSGNDTLSGLGGNDELYGDAGKDNLYGGLDNDILHGGSEKDTLYGNEGDDIIFGGTQADTLYGGSGADTFWFDANDKGTGIDIIKDFSLLDGDKINISDVLEQYDPYADTVSDFVRLTVSETNTLLQVDMTGPGVTGGFTTIASLEGVIGLDLNTLVNNGTIIV